MTPEQDDVEQHNRRELWRDVANHLRGACESLEQAQTALEDLNVPQISDTLARPINTLKRFADLAQNQAWQRENDGKSRT